MAKWSVDMAHKISEPLTNSRKLWEIKVELDPKV